MGRIVCRCATDGWYALDVSLGARREILRIDTGIVDPLGRNGLDLDGDLWDDLKAAGVFTHYQYRYRRDSSGSMTLTATGRIAVQLIDPVGSNPVGPIANVYASRCPRGVPSRVGVVCFHSLVDCSTSWDFNARQWYIDYP